MNGVTEAAVRLHDFIRSNAGETDDWPLQIRSTDPKVIWRLDQLLRDLKESIEHENQPQGQADL